MDIVNNGGLVSILPSFTRPTEIDDAVTAISSDGGIVQIRYAGFDHNLTAIDLHPSAYTFATSTFIKGTDFKCTGGFINKPLYAGKIPFEHLHIENVDIFQTGTHYQLVIGETGGSGLRNDFSDAVTGIGIYNSNVDVVYSSFTNINNYKHIYTCTGCGIGISGKNTGTTSNTINVFGNRNVYPNTFDQVETGIKFEGDISGTIEGNTFTNTNRGVYAHNMTTATYLRVDSNRFDNTGYVSPTTNNNYYSTAITLQNNLLVSPALALIDSNTITNYRLGIHATNIKNIKIGDYSSGAPLPNVIKYNVADGTLLSDKHTAIWLQHCNNASVKVNEITNDAQILYNPDLIRGIEADNSQNMIICGNVITRLGHAMRFEGNCLTSRLKNNNMTDYYQGVHFENAKFSRQGNVNDPWNNEWNRTDNNYAGFQKVDGSFSLAGAKNWYYSGPISQISNPLYPRPSPSTMVNPVPTSSTTIDCETALITNADFDRDADFGPVVGDSSVYDSYEDMLKYLDKSTLFSRLREDTTLLNIGSTADSSFRAFYDSLLSENIGKFDSVNIAVQSGDLTTAASINASISPSNTNETNSKTINDLIINKILVGDTLNSSDTTALESIFEQHWDTAGYSVYSAAAILFKEYYTPDEVSLRLVQDEHQKSQPKIKGTSDVKVSPNPTNSKLFVSGMTGEKNVIEIFDSYNRLLLRKINVETNGSVDVSKLINGIYNLRIINSTGMYFKTKFVLLK